MTPYAVGDRVLCLRMAGDWLERGKEYVVADANSSSFAVVDEGGYEAWRKHETTDFERVPA